MGWKTWTDFVALTLIQQRDSLFLFLLQRIVKIWCCSILKNKLANCIYCDSWWIWCPPTMQTCQYGSSSCCSWCFLTSPSHFSTFFLRSLITDKIAQPPIRYSDTSSLPVTGILSSLDVAEPLIVSISTLIFSCNLDCAPFSMLHKMTRHVSMFTHQN